MQLKFSETFTGAAGPLVGHTSDSGHTYTGSTSQLLLNGSGGLVGNGASVAADAIVVSNAQASSNASVASMSSTFTLTASAGYGLYIGSQDGQNGYLIVLGLNTMTMYKRVAGVNSPLGTVAPLTTGTKTVDFDWSNGSQIVRLNGTQIGSTYDTTHNGSLGRFYGFYRDGAAANVVADSATGSDNAVLDAEAVRDTIAAALVAGTGVTIAPNDAGDTITISASGGAFTLQFRVENGVAGLVSDPAIVPRNCTIAKVTIVSKVAGTVSAHLETAASYASYPGGFASISASAPITLSTATQSQNSTLTGWTKALTAGQFVQLVVDAVSGTDDFTVYVEMA